MANIVIQERDAFQAEKKKSDLQDQANDPTLWDVLKRKFKKSSTSNTFYKDDDFHSQHHDDHQDDDAPPEGEKRVKRYKTSKSSSNNINNMNQMHGKRKLLLMNMRDLFFLKNGNTKEKIYILSLYKIHAKSFSEADLEEKMNQ
nr:hypothetical protein [Tanacetum cinerariifolium]